MNKKVQISGSCGQNLPVELSRGLLTRQYACPEPVALPESDAPMSGKNWVVTVPHQREKGQDNGVRQSPLDSRLHVQWSFDLPPPKAGANWTFLDNNLQQSHRARAIQENRLYICEFLWSSGLKTWWSYPGRRRAGTVVRFDYQELLGLKYKSVWCVSYLLRVKG